MTYNNQKIALEFKVNKDKNIKYYIEDDVFKLNKFLTDEDKQLNLSAYQMMITYSNQKNSSFDFKDEVKKMKKKLETHHDINEVVFLYDRDLRYSRKAIKNTLYISKATIDSSTAICGFVKIT